MALLILIVIGAVLGWLTTIILEIEDPQRVAAHAAIGSGGAVAAGFFVSGGFAIGSLSPLELLAGVAGTCAALFLYRYLQRTEIR